MLQDPKATEPQQPDPAGEQIVGQPVPAPKAVPPEKKLLQNPDYLWTVGLLALVILGGAIAFGILDKWRRRQTLPGRWENTGMELNSFRDMLDSGEITHSEYEKIRDKVATKVKANAGLKKLPIQPPATGDSPPPPEPPTVAPPSEKT